MLTDGQFGSLALAAVLQMAAAEMMAAGMVADEVVAADMVAAEMVATGMVAAEVVAADMVAAELVDAEMVAAEMVAAEMVSAGLPCDHSSFAATLPSLPFWLVLPHPSGSVTHPRPLAPLHAGRLPVCHGSAAHGPLRPQRGSSPLQHTRPGIASRVCQTSASCGSLRAS
ncbi:unnamed protein product [Closterium sp. Naga37s-1]|nr:unnamed protein product [Closterium sp. Naga37s-1]